MKSLPSSLTFALNGERWRPDVVVGAPVSDDDHDLALVGFGFAEELLSGEGDGCPCAGAPAPVVDALDGVEQLGLVVMLAKRKFKPLLVGILDGAHARVRVGDLKLARHVGHELQHSTEVARTHAAGAIDDEGNVVGIQARLAAHQAVCVTDALDKRLHSFTQTKPAGDRQGEVAIGPADSLEMDGNHWELIYIYKS